MPLKPLDGGRARYSHLYVTPGGTGVAVIMLDKYGKACGRRCTLAHWTVEVDRERLDDFCASAGRL